jgi:hypothetical protein
MIDLRMVTDDHGYMQLQSRGFCIQRGWTEWKSVPIVHDPSQLVDRVEIFDAKSSGAKPDGGLTREQVEKLLGELEEDYATHSANFQRAAVNNETYSHQHQRGMAGGISVCLGRIRSKLSPQPDEPEIDL